MKAILYTDTPVESILTYIKEHDNTKEMSKVISSAHEEDLLFSDRYVVKRIMPGEMACYTTILQQDNEVRKRFLTFLPTVHALLYDTKKDKSYIAMGNFLQSNTCTQIEYKIGFYNYLPTHDEQKQQSKLRSAFLLGSIDNGYRVCMYVHKDIEGNLIDSKRIEKIEGVKQIIDDDCFLKILQSYSNKKFALDAADYFIARLRELREIFSEGINDLKYIITASSIALIIDEKNHKFDLKMFDFGCSVPCNNMSIWNKEQAACLEKLIKQIESYRNCL